MIFCLFFVDSHAPSEEDEFAIAADLTLYTNPLNKCLHVKKRESVLPAGGGTPAAQKPSAEANTADDDERAMVAADMTMYDSPMAKLERSAADCREARENAAK